MDERQRVVDEVLAQVVAVLRGGGGLDRVVVVDELGRELVGLAVEEPVEPVEPPLAGPLVVRAGRRRVLHLAQVPLAEGEGGVPGVAQHLGHRGGVVRQVPAHVRVAAVEVRHGAHADRVVVAPRQERRPRRRAERRDVEVREAQPARGQPVDVRRVDVGPEAPEVGVAQVVEQDDHHVRGVLARMRRRRPPGLGLAVRAADRPAELLVLLHRERSPGDRTGPNPWRRPSIDIRNAKTYRASPDRASTIPDHRSPDGLEPA